jgi:hypothetical protein
MHPDKNAYTEMYDVHSIPSLSVLRMNQERSLESRVSWFHVFSTPVLFFLCASTQALPLKICLATVKADMALGQPA